jgi:hypothetical protein
MSEIMNKDDNPEVGLLWTREQEELLKDWCDIANCFRWLHEQGSFKYRKINNRIALPVIVLSTLTGTANFGMKSLVPEPSQQLAAAIVGGVNIFCGILTTIQTYFRYAELTEGHSSASKMWSKFQRLINIELAIEPSKRRHPNDFLKFCIDEYDKLKELSPIIPKDIAMEFKHKFKKTINVFKPDIYDHLGQTLTYLDYVSRNKTGNPQRNTTDIDELQSIRIDNSEVDIRHGKPRPSAMNHPSVNDLKNKFIGSQINNAINKSIADKRYSLESVNRPSKDPKSDLDAELKALRPNIKGLINKLNGIEEISLNEDNKDAISVLKDRYMNLSNKEQGSTKNSEPKSRSDTSRSDTSSDPSGIVPPYNTEEKDVSSENKSKSKNVTEEVVDLSTDINLENVKNI